MTKSDPGKLIKMIGITSRANPNCFGLKKKKVKVTLGFLNK
jgi:hypothetical protein